MKQLTALFLIMIFFYSFDTKANNIRGELMGRMKLLEKYRSKLSPKVYQGFLLQYDDIRNGMNDNLQKVAIEISTINFKGVKMLKKNADISSSIQDYESRARNLHHKITQELLNVNQSIREEDNISADNKIVDTIVSLVESLLKPIKKYSCKKARKFYDQTRWYSFEEITTGQNKETYLFLNAANCPN